MLGAETACSAGAPKSRTAVPGNLHYTYVKAGEPGYFYCPKKVAAEFGVRDTMTFLEFKASEFWAAAIEQVERDKAEKARRKEEAAALREAKGWKKPGGPRK